MPLVFVSNADSGELSLLRMAASGELGPPSPLELGGNLMPMALHPGGQTLYVARRSAPLAVISVAVDRASGALRTLGEAALPASMAALATDRSGRWLMAASYPEHLVSLSPIAPDGCAGEVCQVLATPPNAHTIVPSPCNRYALVTSLGGGVVLVLALDAQAGRLQAAGQWQSRPGAGPRHLRFDAQGRFVYVLNELDASLDVLAWDAQRGRLSHVQTLDTLPPGWVGQPWAADLHLSPDGRHLYSSERNSSTVAQFAVDRASGRLSLVAHAAVEAQPRGFAISPDGRQLLVAGQRSHHLGRLLIDPATGALSPAQRVAVGQGPNWVEILP